VFGLWRVFCRYSYSTLSSICTKRILFTLFFMQSAKESVNCNLGSNGRHIQQVEAFLVILLSKNLTVLILLYRFRKKCHEKFPYFTQHYLSISFETWKNNQKWIIESLKNVLVKVITAAGVLCSFLLCYFQHSQHKAL